MGRRPAEDPRDQTITLRVTQGEREQLDTDRGGMSMSDYLRSRLLNRRR